MLSSAFTDERKNYNWANCESDNHNLTHPVLFYMIRVGFF